jgi:Flp pilus assembly protein TadD
VPKRKTVSLIISLALAFAVLAPQAALGNRVFYGPASGATTAVTPAPESFTIADTAESGAEATGEADDSQQPKRNGNGFARALSAPFRALARLFGGGKKSKPAEAKMPTPPPTVEGVVNAGTLSAATEETKASPGGDVTQAVDRTQAAGQTQAATNVGPVDGSPATVRVGVELPRGSSVVQATEGARIIRPAAGEVAEELRPKMWIPLIAGIPSDPVSQGRALLQHGYLQEAIAELQTAATNVGTDLAEANNLLGLAYDRLGWHKQAAEAYGRSLTVTPKDANVLANLGYSLYLDGDYAAALKRLKQAANLSPAEPIISNNLGIVHARLGHYGDAFKYFVRASNEYEAHLKLADILETEKRDRDAVKHYEAALRIQPGASAVLERLVALYERTGARDKADTARRALGQPRNPQKTTTGGGD